MALIPLHATRIRTLVAALLLAPHLSAEATPQITAVPSEIEFTTTVVFDGQGDFKYAEEALQVRLRLTPPPGLQLASTGPITVTTATTDAGDHLIRPQAGTNGIVFPNEFRAVGHYELSIDLQVPCSQATKISELTASFDATIVGGTPGVSRFESLGSWTGRPVMLEPICRDAVITHSNSLVTLKGHREILHALKTSRFFTAEGVRVVPFRASNSGDFGEDITISWGIFLPPDGTMELTFVTDNAQVPVNIQWTDLPLPGSLFANRPVIPSIPVPLPPAPDATPGP